MSADAEDTRDRILRAAVTCAGRVGLGRLTIEHVAQVAGVGRATVYRHFPHGREEVVSAAIADEVARFFRALAAHVESIDGLAARLEAGLGFAHRAVARHDVLQRVVETEPERFLPHLNESGPLVKAVVVAYLRPLLEKETLRPGVDPQEAADWLARHILSFIVAEGVWHLDDPADVRRLVRGSLLAGVLGDPGDPDEPVVGVGSHDPALADACPNGPAPA